MSAKWRFYTIKHDRRALWLRTSYFSDAQALHAAPPNALALLPQADALAKPPGGWATIGVVKNLMGEPTAVVIRRQP